MSSDRYDWIDVIKGICICLVMFGHVTFNNTHFKAFSSLFYVTTFLVLSGYLFAAKNKNQSSIKGMLYKVIWPYAWFSLFAIAADVLLSIFNGNDFIKVFLVDFYKTITLYGILALWYLPSYFIASAIFLYFKDRINRVLLCIVSLLLAVFSVLMSLVLAFCSNNMNALLYNLVQYPIVGIFRSSACVLFIYVGYTLYNSHILDGILSVNRKLFGLVFLLVAYLASLFALDRNFSMLNFGINPISVFVGGIMGALGLIMMFYDTRIKFLEWLGRNSLLLLITHMTFKITDLSQLIAQLFINKDSNYFSIICFIVMLPIEIAIVLLFNKKLRFFIEKREHK